MKEKKEFGLIQKMILVIGVIAVALVIFELGIAVGYNEAVFSGNWSMAYMRSFNDRDSIFAPFLRDTDDVNPHGALGEIVKVNLPQILVKGQTSAEQVIVVGSSTIIKEMRNVASTSDLVSGAQVIVIGRPDGKGGVDAAFIRIVPPPPPPPPSTSPFSSP